MSLTFAQAYALREFPSPEQEGETQTEFWGTHRVKNWAESPGTAKREQCPKCIQNENYKLTDKNNLMKSTRKQRENYSKSHNRLLNTSHKTFLNAVWKKKKDNN